MARIQTKLELTWIGKENRPKLEPRILVDDSAKSYHAAHQVGENDIFDNRLIFGDNLLALILENDDVLKWFKLAKGDFQIHHSHEESYEPGFVVEARTGKMLCEPKRANETTDAEVPSKADAAATWCKHATADAGTNGGKPWSYLLIPHDMIDEAKTLGGLAAAYTRTTDGLVT